MTVGWTQPLCTTCFAAWQVGKGEIPREPVRITNHEGDPCLICGEQTTIYTRIDPKIAEVFTNAKHKEED